MKLKPIARTLAATIGLLCSATSGADDLTNLGLGMDCSSGRYGSPVVTRACAFPAYLDVYRGKYEFKVTLPLIASRSEGSTVRGTGDLGFYVARTLELAVPGIDEIDLAGRVKFNNGNAVKSLGSGHVDYQLEADFVKSWGPALLIVYIGATYTAGIHGRNTLPYSTLWFKYQLTPEWKFGFMYENSNLIDSARAVRDIVLIPEFKATPKLTLRPMIYRGLTRGTARLGGGLTLIRSID